MSFLILLSIITFSSQTEALETNFMGCETCKMSLKGLRDTARQIKHWEWAANYSEQICTKVMGADFTPICTGFIVEFKQIVVEMLMDRLIEPEHLCAKLEYCKNPKIIPENFTAYVEKVMKGKPPGPGPQPSGGKTFKFIHISDVHLDLHYKEGTLATCDQPLCCRDGVKDGTKNNMAGYWGGLVCDLPLRTLNAALEQIKQLDPEFIIITGDFSSHDVWDQSKEYLDKYQEIVSKAFKSKFPNTPIYVLYGNHACLPINQCSFGADYWLPKAFSNYWNLTDPQLVSLETHAGFMVRHKKINLKIMNLDTNVFNGGDIYLMQNNTNPMGTLDWIYDELLKAEKNNEQVYIMGHMSPGDIDALPAWAKHFNVLVDRFEYTIAGMFFGHSHNDEIHINTGVYSNKPTKVHWIAPSFTTFSELNPSFRLFEADEQSKVLLDFAQYRLNLTNANMNPNKQPVWDISYLFKNYYGLADISASSVYKLAAMLGVNEQQSLRYLSNFYTGGNLTPKQCDRKCQQINTCRMIYSDSDNVFKCQGLTFNSLFYGALNWMFNDWAYRVK